MYNNMDDVHPLALPFTPTSPSHSSLNQKAKPVVPCVGGGPELTKRSFYEILSPCLVETLYSDTAIVCACGVPKQLSMTAVESNIDRVKWLQIAPALFCHDRECCSLIRVSNF